jgi:2,4-dienoyl-CoA reductase-like NADH-dependent reductase (Old Yellow Enzyme family)
MNLSENPKPIFQRLTSPIRLRGHQLKNRLFFAPMGLDLANRNGTFSDELFDFYNGMIAGGCGMIILSNASVSPDSILQPNGLRLVNEIQAQSLRKIVEAADAAGTMIGMQLQHYGGQGVTTYTRGKPLLTPSGVPSAALKKKDNRYRVRVMTQEDIDLVITQFAEGARLAEMTGTKLIQLQGSNGYLLGSFQSPATNLRNDKYGGDAIGRGRLLLEVIQAVRAAVSPSMILSVRLGIDDYLGPRGTVAEDFSELIPMYEAAGVDLIETSICVADTFSVMTGEAPEVRALLQSSTKTIRGYSKVPVGFAGLVRSIEQAEELLQDEVADFIGMARALFADNDLLVKTLTGRRDEIHWCLWDGKCFKDKHNPRYQRVYCCVNPKYKRPE